MHDTTSPIDWLRAVLRRSPLTRHLHIDVLAVDEGHVCLEGRVPTRADRARAGTTARSALPEQMALDNHLYVAGDLAGIAATQSPSARESRQPRWRQAAA